MSTSGPTPGPFMSPAGLETLVWIGVALSCVLVSLRTWIQVRVTGRMFVNDYLIIIALILHIATTAIIQAARPYTYELLEATAAAMQGKQPDMEYYLVRMPMFLRYQLALSIMFWSTLWAVKFALLSFFWRLFDSVKTHARIFWWFMVAVTASTLTVSVFLQLFACGTPANFTTADGCAKRPVLYKYLAQLTFLFSSGTDIGTDILLTIIPFPLIYKLNVNQAQKQILAAIFLLPLLPALFGSLKLAFCHPGNQQVDVLKFQVFSSLESSAALTTACIPAFRLFATKQQGSKTGGSFYASGSKSLQANKGAGTGSIPLGNFSAARKAGTGDPAGSYSNLSDEAILKNDREGKYP